MQNLTTSPFGFKADFSSSSRKIKKSSQQQQSLRAAMPLHLQRVPLSLLQKQVQTLGLGHRAKAPAVSHDHQSCSQTLLAIVPTATRMLRGCGQVSPCGTPIPSRAEHPGISPSTSPCSPGSPTLAQAEPTAKPSPTQREKLHKAGLKLLLHPQSGVAAPQTQVFNPFWITGER